MARRSFEPDTVSGESFRDITAGADAVPAALPEVCARIRRFREKLGIGQKELARRIGVTGNAVSNWENGRSRPDIYLLPVLSSILQVSLYELFGMDDPAVTLSAPEEQHIASYRRLSAGHRHAVDALTESLLLEQRISSAPALLKLPLFDKPLAAGIGDPAEFEQHSVPLYLYAGRIPARADSVFSVSGDSMEPVYHDHDLVYVERLTDGTLLKPGETGAFITGNECYIKIYREDGLYSYNPAYPPMNFRGGESVYLIGRVLGIVPQGDIASKDDAELYRTLQL